MSESGYLDDASGSRSTLAPTSLVASLAQRQMSQAHYDDASAWSTPPSRRGSQSSYTTTSDSALQREWDEQLDQLKLMFQIIIFPFAGKFFGRKFAYFLFNRYKVLGSPLSKAFWTGLAAATA